MLHGNYSKGKKIACENIPQNHVDGGYKCGSHDWYTWSQHLYEFAGDVCWSRS